MEGVEVPGLPSIVSGGILPDPSVSTDLPVGERTGYPDSVSPAPDGSRPDHQLPVFVDV